MQKGKDISSGDAADRYEYDFVPEAIIRLSKDGPAIEELLQRSYYMYFDESNNFKKIHVKLKDGKRQLNFSDLAKHFVFGGIALKQEQTPPTIDDIKAVVGISPKQKMAEIKSKNIYSGDLQTSLSSDRLGCFLDWVIGNGWFVHFESLNFLYYCISDIVAAFVWNSLQPGLLLKNFYELHEGFYRIFKLHQHDYLQKLVDFGYPNITPNALPEFKQWLTEITERYIAETNDTSLIISYLRTVFRTSIYMGNVFQFVPDADSGEYIDKLDTFYFSRIATFRNSQLWLDGEGDIEKDTKELLQTPHKIKNNFQFIKSDSCTWIQISDIMMGIIRKYVDFLDFDIDYVKHEISTWSEQSVNNLRKLNHIISYSIAENRLFIQHIDRITTRDKLGIICSKYKL